MAPCTIPSPVAVIELRRAETIGLPAMQSLAARLMRTIFGCYLAVALLMMGFQLFAEYRDVEGRLERDLLAIQRSFGPGIADALWRYNRDVVAGILSGLKETPFVTGIEVTDEYGQFVDGVGSPREGRPADTAPWPDVLTGYLHTAGLAGVVVETVPLAHVDDQGHAVQVGALTVVSDRRIVWEQVWNRALVVALDITITTAALWLICFVVIRHMVGRPLRQMSAFLATLDLDRLDAEPFALRAPGRHELHLLAGALDALKGKLLIAFQKNAALVQDLQDLNATLLDKVAERTREFEIVARTDLLTGLFNRRKLDETIDGAVERAVVGGGTLSVILGDVDHFKSVNDTYGHKVGDIVLAAFAANMRDGLRPGDTLGRWGGEEFLIVCPDTDLAAAVAIADGFRRRMAETELPIAGRRTCSFGVAELVDGEGVDVLMARADAALYAAKQNGRNRVETGGGLQRFEMRLEVA